MRTGVFGGTFDPIHFGHLRVAEEVREKLGLDRVLFIPAGDPPLRPGPATPALDRLAMVRAAIRGHAPFQALDCEIRRPGKSYTADTLAELQRRFPGDHFFLILGADQLRRLPRWHQPERILKTARIVGISRPGTAVPVRLLWRFLARFPAPLRRVLFLKVSILEISSTEIRRRIRAGHSIRYLVPEPVARHIRKRGLYLANAEDPARG